MNMKSDCKILRNMISSVRHYPWQVLSHQLHDKSLLKVAFLAFELRRADDIEISVISSALSARLAASVARVRTMTRLI